MSKPLKLGRINFSNPKVWVVIGIGVAGIVILTETHRRRRRKARMLEREDFGAFIERFELLPFPQPPPPAARQSLSGLTFAVKDMFDVKGYVTGFGNPDWKRTHEVAEKTAVVVTALLKNGATCVGKTVMDELAFGVTGENIHYGTPTNPQMPSQMPGGSSSGSAVAVAAELVNFALGTDTIGCVRTPASFCGILGFRPSHGVVSAIGILPNSQSLDTVGLFARDPSILHRVGHVLLQTNQVEPRRSRRFIFAEDLFQLSKVPKQKTVYVVSKVVENLAGYQTPKHMNFGEYIASNVLSLKGFCEQSTRLQSGISTLKALSSVMLSLQRYEFKTNHEDWVKSVKPRLGPDVSDRVLAAVKSLHENIKTFYKVRTEMRAALRNLLKDDGILVIPTIADSSLKLNSKKGLLAEFRDKAYPLLSIASMSGCCQVSIPLGKHDDCPISVSFLASHGADKFLLDTVLDMYSSLQEQASIASNSLPLPDINGNMDTSELLKEKGNAAFKGRQWNKAVNYYSEAIKLNETNATYYCNRAAAYLELGCFQQAEEDCSKAILLDKKNVKAYLRRGTAREALLCYKEAAQVIAAIHEEQEAARRKISRPRGSIPGHAVIHRNRIRDSFRATSRRFVSTTKTRSTSTMVNDEENVGNTKKQLAKLFEASLKATVPNELDVEPLVAACTAKFGDYQCNNAMSIWPRIKEKGTEYRGPPSVGQAIMRNLPPSEMIESCSVAGPGFVNVVLSRDWIAKKIQKMLNDGIGTWAPALAIKRAVVDFSSPNIAKEMHVGNLRSTIIGDTLARMLEYSNVEVLRRNHVGDWGTQFGMLIEFLFENFPRWEDANETAIGDLQAFYKASKQKFDSDPVFKERAQQAVVRLQGGEPKYRSAWAQLCDISRKEFEKVYQRLGVQLEEKGESFYNPYIPGVIEALIKQGLVEESQGARVIFIEGVNIPLIVVKSDGGYNYASTDLAALWYRLNEEKAEWMIYVTDVGQQQHFEMVFSAAKRAGWLPADGKIYPKTSHVGFGLVLGEDGKRFRTRNTEVVRLVDLLDEAKSRSKSALVERGKAAEWTEEELEQTAEAVGYGAVKYADLKNNRLTNYTFNFDQMLNDKGNTAVYLLYAHARICSIIRKSGKDIEELKKTGAIVLDHPDERALGLHLLQFAETVEESCTNLLPNVLCEYLYNLSENFTKFYSNCQVVGSAEETSRLLICEATAVVMRKCFHLLGIVPVYKI